MLSDCVPSSAPAAGGDLYVWGQGDMELGVTPDKEGTVPLPTRVTSLPAQSVAQVCLGDTFTLVRLVDGAVMSFGHNTKGRLLGRPGEGPVPKLVIGGATHIAAGQSHSLAVTGDNGAVFAWGNAMRGALGNPDNTGSDGLKPVLHTLGSKGSPGEPLTGAVAVEAGFQNSAALMRDGRVAVWGCNHHGKAGGGAPGDVVSPVAFLDLPGPAATIACGSLYSAATLRDGTLLTWGYGGAGNLGHGDRRSRSTPTVVEALRGRCRVVRVACTRGQINPVTSGKVNGTEQPHTFAVDDEGRAWAFGTCHKGMLGNHTNKILSPPTGDELAPYCIGGQPTRDGKGTGPSGYLGGLNIVGAASASIHSLLLAANGDVFGFGCGSGGRLGVSKYLTGLHGARSRMKCYISQPTVLERFAEGGLRVAAIATARRVAAAIVVGRGDPRPTELPSAAPQAGVPGQAPSPPAASAAPPQPPVPAPSGVAEADVDDDDEGHLERDHTDYSLLSE